MKGLQWLILLVLMVSAQPSFGGTVTYIYTDPQGTPLAEADAQGNVTARFDYRPYGAQALGTPPAGPGYTGHVNDPDTGLVYMEARYYDPGRGGFLSVDPVGPTAGNIFSFNRYAYANNNPIVNMDPDGRESACVSMGQSCLPPNSDMVGAAKMAVSMVPVVGDAVNISDAYNDPSFANIAIAVVGIVPEVGTAIADVAKVAKAAKVASEAERGAADVAKAGKETGSYTNFHESGKSYSGKGNRARSQVSARRVEKATGDKHVATDWTAAPNSREAFKQESGRLDGNGGPGSSGNYNKIESPGKKMCQQDGGC